MRTQRVQGLPVFRNLTEAKVVLGKQVTRQTLAAQYVEQFGPAVINHWQSCRQRQSSVPFGYFGRTLQGKLNFGIVFRHVVEDESCLGLKFAQATRTVPQQLLRANQPAYLASVLGLTQGSRGANWDQVITKYAIRSGLRNLYHYSIFEAFVDPDHYGWAFEYETEDGSAILEGHHLHRSDFRETCSWDNLAQGSLAWREIDHFFRSHWGITVYDEAIGTFDPRLLPANHEALLEEVSRRLGRRIGSFYELIYNGGLGMLVLAPQVRGQPGRLMQICYPQAFAYHPKDGPDRHLRAHWFKQLNTFGTPAERIAAFLHELEVCQINLKDVPSVCTRQWFDDHHLGDCLLVKGTRVSALVTFFKTHFPERFDDGTWHEGDFPPAGAKDKKQQHLAVRKIRPARRDGETHHRAIFYFDGHKYILPKEYTGLTIRRVSASFAIIYRSRKVFDGQGKHVQLVPIKGVVLRTQPKGSLTIILQEGDLLEVNSLLYCRMQATAPQLSPR